MASKTPVLDRLMGAFRETSSAREALRNVPWPDIALLLRGLGSDQPPAVVALLTAGVGDCAPRDLVPLRGALAAIGDRAIASAIRFSDRRDHSQAAVGIMCSELVDLIGAALTLADVASVLGTPD
jgi:hypothetical protein